MALRQVATCQPRGCIFKLETGVERSPTGVGVRTITFSYIQAINDLDNNISSDVLKFADDTKIYRTVTNQEDGQRLQKDLDTVGAWAVRWQMKFTVEICKVLHYGRNSIGCHYNMYGQLAEATAEKDLGVVFSNDLKVVQHCREAYSKANQILGLVRKTIAFKNPAVLISLYKSLVRPHLEYCSVIWSPHYTNDKVLLERESSTGLHACLQS